jgi:hypothetical protein
MAQTVSVNLIVSPIGRHSPAPSGDLNAGDVSLSYDPAKLTTAVPIESLLAFLRTALLSRGFKP